MNVVQERRAASQQESALARVQGVDRNVRKVGTAAPDRQTEAVDEVVSVDFDQSVDEIAPDDGNAAVFQVAQVGYGVNARRKVDAVVGKTPETAICILL